MTVQLLTKHHLEFLILKGGCTGCLSLHLSKCHIVGNQVSRLNIQGLHRLEKYLNVQDCIEKSLKIKFTLKST